MVDIGPQEEDLVTTARHTSPLVRATMRLEDAAVLDGPVRALEPRIRAVFGTGVRGSVLRGDWLGHAVHPVLTDVVIGSWTSATVLDVVGRGQWSAPAKTLVGVGLTAFAPTAWTGWAEWSNAGHREKRVGVVHAVVNGLSAGVFTASWVARRQGRHAAGARLALVGMSISGAGAFLGGHLAAARKVSSHHPAFDSP